MANEIFTACNKLGFDADSKSDCDEDQEEKEEMLLDASGDNDIVDEIVYSEPEHSNDIQVFLTTSNPIALQLKTTVQAVTMIMTKMFCYLEMVFSIVMNHLLRNCDNEILFTNALFISILILSCRRSDLLLQKTCRELHYIA